MFSLATLYLLREQFPSEVTFDVNQFVIKKNIFLECFYLDKPKSKLAFKKLSPSLPSTTFLPPTEICNL